MTAATSTTQVLPPVLTDELQLRLLLGLRVAGASLYTEGGEMLDLSAWPHIDFRRDSPEAIGAKLAQRAHSKERVRQCS